MIQDKYYSILLLVLLMITLPNCSEQKISDESLILANEDVLRVNEGIVDDIEMMKKNMVKINRRIFLKGGDCHYYGRRMKQVKRVTEFFNETCSGLVHSFLKAANVAESHFDQYLNYSDTSKAIVGIKLDDKTLKNSRKKRLIVGELSFSFQSEKDYDIEELLMSLRDSIIKGILFHPPHYIKYERPINLSDFHKLKGSFFYDEIVKPFFYELYFDEIDISNHDDYFEKLNLLAQLNDLNKQHHFSDNVIRLNRLLLTLRKLQYNLINSLSDTGPDGFSFTRITIRAKPRYSALENIIELKTVSDVNYDLLRYSFDPTLPKSEWISVSYEDYQNNIVFDTIFDSATVVYLDIQRRSYSEKDTIWLEMTDTIGPKQFQPSYE